VAGYHRHAADSLAAGNFREWRARRGGGGGGGPGGGKADLAVDRVGPLATSAKLTKLGERGAAGLELTTARKSYFSPLSAGSRASGSSRSKFKSL